TSTSRRDTAQVAQNSSHVATERGIGIEHYCLVGGAWAGVELGQERVVAWAGVCPGNSAGRVVQVAEDNRRGGTGGLTRGNHFAVGDRPVLAFGLNARLANTLQAVGALQLHYTFDIRARWVAKHLL